MLKALHVPAEDYIAKHERLRDGSEPWTLYRITAAGGVRAEESKTDPGAAAAAGAGAGAGGAGAGTGGAAGSGTPVEIKNPPPLDGSVDIDTVMQGPTEATNWLVPGAVLMGRLPYYEDEVAGILNAGVTTIVPLVEEISMKHDYPAHIKALLQAQVMRAAQLARLVLLTSCCSRRRFPWPLHLWMCCTSPSTTSTCVKSRNTWCCSWRSLCGASEVERWCTFIA